MNPDTLRKLDFWLGSFLCVIAGLATRNRPGQPGPLPAPQDVLIIKLTEMGSTVLAMPALRELRDTWPNARLHFLVFRNARAILDLAGLGPADQVLEVDDRSAWRALWSGWSALRKVRRMRPAIAIDFDFFSRFTALFAFLSCRGARVGFDAFAAAVNVRGRLLTHRVVYSPVQHTSAAFLSLTRTVTHASEGEPFFRGSVADASLELPVLQPSADAVRECRDLLADLRVPESAPIVLFSTNASSLLPLRRWSADRFVDVARKLGSDDPTLWILLVGGPDEQGEGEALARRINHPRCASVAGRTSFPAFLALCARAKVLLCNDGGPAHFAGLVRLPSVVLFGPETPALYRPLSPDATVLYRALPCSPCVHVFNAKKSRCPRAMCLEAIEVNEVLGAVREKLAGRGAGTSC